MKKHRLIGILAFLALFLPIWAFVLPGSGEATQSPIMVDMILTRSHVQPGQALSGVVGVRTLVPGAVTFDLTLPAGLTLESIESLGGNTCTTSGQTVRCSAANAQNGNPQQLTARLMVDSTVAAGMDLTAIATGTISGTTVVAQDTAFVIGAPATATPSLQPTAAATAQPTAAATAQPTAAATTQPTAGSLPVVAPTDDGGTDTTQGTETPVLPSDTSVTTPSEVPASDSFDAALIDRFENNYDPFHASLIAPGAVITGLNFVAPSTVITGDVDYVQWFGKANRCYQLETQELHPDLDTNIEIVTAANDVLAGNDDETVTNPASKIQWCPISDGTVFARIAQNSNVPLPDPRGKTYVLALRVGESEPASEPTSVPVDAPAISTSPDATGKGDVPQVKLPSMPAFVAPAGGGSVVSVSVPAAVGVTNPASTNSEPVVSITTGNDTPSTVVACDPLIDAPVEVEDTNITAGVETCENQIQIADLEMPTGTVHVAATMTALYSGPGAQYAQLAILPADTDLQMTGRYRNGWVAVRMTTIPLIGWVFAAHLQVDSWDSTITLPAPAPTPAPVVTNPRTPTAIPVIPSTQGSVGIGTPLQIQIQPSQRINVVVQICSGSDTTANCVAGDGITQAPVTITNRAGDVIATGITDGTGRWIVQLPRSAGRVVLHSSLLGRTAEIDLAASQGSQLFHSLIVRRVDIPPTFR